MSILLDALKKSEAQRQLGETPTIHTSVDPASADSGTVKPWLVGLLLLSVAIVLALFITEQFDEPDLSILGYSEFGPTTRVDPVADAAGQAEPEAKDARTPVETLRPSLAARPTTTNRDRQTSAALRQSVSDYRPPPQASQASQADRASAASAPMRAAAADTRATGTPDAAEDQKIEAPPMLTYWQLPQGIRDNMPDMKISVLVYAAKPEERFILMEGKRLREGDDAGGGLDLEEIRRDGAVFSYRKYTFLLPN